MAIVYTYKEKRLLALKDKLDKLTRPVDQETAHAVGVATIKEMTTLIERGISPIEGSGRFPAYKAQAKKNLANKLARGLKRSGNAAGAARAKAKASEASKGYPYNTEEFKKGSKKDRPVNLWLKGDFLRALKYRLKLFKGSYVTDIGFFDPKQEVKEQGHREGANGQPKRPIIPTSQEGFAQRIQRIFFTIYRNRVRQLLGK